MKKVHLLNKVLYNVKIKDITELNDTMLVCAHVVTEEFDRAKWNGNQ